MPALKEGSKAPSFKMKTQNGDTVTLKDYAGAPLVLYFYPKDDTPGCTTQACSFRDNLPKFKKSKAAILGVSRDPVDRHVKFSNKYDLNFPLAADEDGTATEKYGVWVEKSLYGKKYMGIERTTFLIDADGKIAKIWRKVKVPGHAEDVLDAVKAL
ncbi:thioredoxin-dependent thiol peroxidase [Micavibrio aeruginosavorus]|uniref:thioredoxin-dependent peroxiredoxin n=1 Tax=Micavibrio aeruginosavorus EPB TaxID=349215 RepID=M4VL01_9BACT|nr:thioredoxin-dependent thiol peroxidase [Micavibrio aeruginosavorus]AGH98791.1 Thiol peroxidase, Bcp-type [Micavibrio aeruginosavorus EPB]